MAQQMPPKDHMVLYEKCVPPLQTGVRYHLELDQTLKKGNDARVDNNSQPIPTDQRFPFEIQGPRFTLQPDDIHGIYPADRSRGPFGSRLPQIVMRRRTLPWERQVGTGTDDTPWMALMLFKKWEVQLLEPATTTIGSLLNPGQENIRTPRVTNMGSPPSNTERQQPCYGIRVGRRLFEQVAPTLEEVRLLSHVRQVNTEDKELLGMDKDGWFAVTVGNRLPIDAEDYVACLVSLEGAGHLLPSADEFVASADQPLILDTLEENAERFNLTVDPNWRNIATTGEVFIPPIFEIETEFVQLITLARWEFHSQGTGDFENTMRAMPTSGGVEMLGATHQTATADAQDISYQVALDSGHVPLRHSTWAGEETVAWYRGPLTPSGVKRDKSIGPFHSADQARRVDPETGLENLGYASAFEVGRLMAMADKRFGVSLMQWRRGSHQSSAKRLSLELILNNIPPIYDALQIAELMALKDLEDLIQKDLWGPLIDPTGIDPDFLGTTLPGFEPTILMNVFGEDFVNVLTGISVEGVLVTEFGNNAIMANTEILQDFNSIAGNVQTLDHLRRIRGHDMRNMHEDIEGLER
jgi:hypothetical protein